MVKILCTRNYTRTITRVSVVVSTKRIIPEDLAGETRVVQ